MTKTNHWLIKTSGHSLNFLQLSSVYVIRYETIFACFYGPRLSTAVIKTFYSCLLLSTAVIKTFYSCLLSTLSTAVIKTFYSCHQDFLQLSSVYVIRYETIFACFYGPRLQMALWITSFQLIEVVQLTSNTVNLGKLHKFFHSLRMYSLSQTITTCLISL